MTHLSNNSRTPFARKLLTYLLIAGFVILALHLLFQALNLLVYHQQHGQFYELSNRFDFDDESSVPTWFSQLLFLMLSAGAALAAYLTADRRVGLLWTVIAVVALVFSIDEIAGLHEFFLQTLHVVFYQDAGPGSLSNAWLLVAPFVLLVTGIFIVSMLRRFPRRTMFLFTGSVIVFLIGAIGVDAFNSLVERESFMSQGLLVGVEESFEIFSLIIIVYAVADYLERMHGKALHNAWRQLRS